MEAVVFEPTRDGDAKSGDERPTARAVFDEHARYVMRALHYLGVRDAEVEDVGQRVFLLAIAHLERWEPSRGTLRAWLYAYCVRAAANHRRLARIRRESLHDEPPQAPVENEQSLVERDDLAHALDALDEDQRAVFVLHAVEELSMREVAEALGIPMQTGYSRYEAARSKLQEALRSEP